MTISKVFGLLIAVFLLNGCFSEGNLLQQLVTNSDASAGKQVDQKALEKWVVGKTTEADVIKEMGKPTQRQVSSSGNVVLHYHFNTGQTTDRGAIVSYLGSFVPLIGGWLGTEDEWEDVQLAVSFKNGVYSEHTLAKGGGKAGTGVFTQ